MPVRDFLAAAAEKHIVCWDERHIEFNMKKHRHKDETAKQNSRRIPEKQAGSSSGTNGTGAGDHVEKVWLPPKA